MAFIYLNKQTKDALIFGSITSLCRFTGLKKDNFYTHFGRLNNTEFENENVRIIKTDIKRGIKPIK